MAELKRMYRLVKLVDARNRATAEDNFMIGFADEDHSDSILLESKENVFLDYCSNSGLSRHRAEMLLKNAEKREYLMSIPIGANGKEDKLKVSPNGDDLLYKKWKIPTGFIRAFAEANRHISPLLSVILSLVAIGVSIIALSKG